MTKSATTIVEPPRGEGPPGAWAAWPALAPLTAVVICTTGEAEGHGVWADAHFLAQLVAAGNAAPGGVKARFGHAAPLTDPAGTELGRFRRFRGVQDAAGEGQVVADFEPLPTPLNAAALGHVLQLAAQDPGLIGASIEFVPAEPAPPAAAGGLPRERLARLLAIALTSDPATNPGGLF